MKELTSAEQIGPHGYAHWTRSPTTPGIHSITLVPQTIFDGWDAYCSCGEWMTFASFYDFESRDALLEALTKWHEAHVAAMAPVVMEK
jgi:hypothetical protein